MILATVLLLVGFGVWAIREILPVVDGKWKRESDIERQRIDLSGRELAIRERQSERPARPKPMPPDLVALCDAWDDDWAKEDQRRTLESQYAEIGDWDEVRRRIRGGAPTRFEEQEVGS